MRNCFVPECDAMHRNNDVVKRMMFMPPKDDDLFNVWKRSLTGRREFKKTDRVCQRHFDEADIETHWDHIINGVVHKLRRGKPKLRPRAIPKRFLNACHTLLDAKSVNAPRLKDLKRLARKPDARKVAAIEQSTSIELKIEETEPCDDDVNDDDSTPADVEMKPCLDVPADPPRVDDTAAESDDDESTLDHRQSVFDALYDDVFEVELPCTAYGVHRDPERTFVAFSRFSPVTLSTSKAFFVDNSLRTRQLIDGVTVATQKHTDLPMETIATMLGSLDAWELCARGSSSSGTRCQSVAVADKMCAECAQKETHSS